MNLIRQSVSFNEQGFITFMSRTTGLWLILTFIALWIMGQLPHQLHAGSNAFITGQLMSQSASLVPSTLAILFMIVPSRKLGFLCLLSMVFLLLSYHDRNQALKLTLFPLIYLPFLFNPAEFRNAWKWTSRFMILSFLFTAPLIGLSIMALPVYMLLITAFIPWERVFVSFEERFEPK